MKPSIPARLRRARRAVGASSAAATIAGLVGLVGLVGLPATPAGAAINPAPVVPLGNDISWPQCDKSYPTNARFGIVGVNDGRAIDTNSCLASQLVWAKKIRQVGQQAPIQLYVNTGNPAGLGTPSWPTSNTDPEHTVVDNPYGSCRAGEAGLASDACAYMYGWNRAVQDMTERFAPAARAAKLDPDPARYPWWLDVELANTWRMGGTSADHHSNTAVLEGMTAAFEERGVTVGLYATSYQLRRLIGSGVAASSPLRALDSWIPGSADLHEAMADCAQTPLLPEGRVVLTQYVAAGFDFDYSCIG